MLTSAVAVGVLAVAIGAWARPAAGAVVRLAFIGRVQAVALGGLAVGFAVAAMTAERRRLRRGAGAAAACVWLAGAALTGAFASFVATTSSALPVTTTAGGGPLEFSNGYDDIEVELGDAVTPPAPLVSGGTAPYAFSAGPALLGGLSLNASTGEISGTAGGVVAEIVAGGFHTCARFVDGSVKCWGKNDVGQLGAGDTDSRGTHADEMGDALAAVALGAGRTAVELSSGSTHTCARLDDGSVKCWGANDYGQLGLGDTDARGDAPGEMGDVLPAVSLGSGRTAIALTTGIAHTCAILDDGSVKCWGANDYGLLGQGDTDNRGDAPGEMGDALTAVPLGTGRTAVAITGGMGHTCALLDDGTVKCWGLNDLGQLGQGDTDDRGDAPGEMGDDLDAVALGAGRSAVALAAGTNHTCALLDDESVKCWGANYDGELGQGDTDHRGDGPGEMGDDLDAIALGTGRTAVVIAAVSNHVCAVLDDATLKCWGDNTGGVLGLGDTESRGDDPSEMGDPLPAVDLGTGRSAVGVSAGVFHTCALLDDSSTKCWGVNDDGQLGLGHDRYRGDDANEMGDVLPRPRLGTFSRQTTVTVTDDDDATDTDTVTVTIVSGTGPLAGPAFDSTYDPVTLSVGDAMTPQTPVVSGGVAPRAFTVNPSLLGGLSFDPATGEISGTASGHVAQVAAGSGFACARLFDGLLKCWGANGHGQLGLGDTETRGDDPGEMDDALGFVALGTNRTAVSVAAGAFHACAVLDDGSVKCWGANGSGELGLGDTDDRGDEVGEMGDALPAVALGSGRTAVSVTAGYAHTCAVLDDGSVKCWGANGSGELGLGDTDGRGDEVGEMGDALPAVALGSGRTAVSVTAGYAHACAVLDDASVKCWGDGAFGQLGNGGTDDAGDGPGEMGDALAAVALGAGRTPTALAVGAVHNCVLLDDASVKCWGDNANGELGLGDQDRRGDGPGEMGDALAGVALGTGRSATALSVGWFHSCAVLDDDSVKCWGANGAGQLGQGDQDGRGDGPGEMGDALPALALGTGRSAVAITAGLSYTCARLDDSSVKCWGEGSDGVLGFGNAEARGDGANEMGDNLPRIGFGTFVRESTVTVTDDNGSTDSETIEITLSSASGSVPAAPALATEATGTDIDVSWPAVPGAVTYDVQRQASGGSFSSLASGHTTTSYDDTGSSGITYGYQVRACNAYGCSAWSSTASVVIVPAAPGVPALEPGYRTIDVSWSSVTGATTYDVQRNAAGGTYGDHADDATSPLADTGLDDITEYGYAVRACNAGGCSSYSTPATATTAPAIPTGYGAGVSGRTSLVMWNYMPGAATYELQIEAEGGIDAIVDDFERADSAVLLGATSDGARAWTAVAGTWGIDDGEAYVVANAEPSLATIDLGSPDGFVEFTLGAPSETYQGAVVRYQDPDNYWYLVAAPGLASWRLDKIVGGVTTQVEILAFAPNEAGTVVRLEFEGATIRAYFNGNLWATVTDADLSGATGVGLRAGTGVTNAVRWDDFSTGQLTTVTSPTTGLVSNVYVDSALASGTTYTYTVRACNAASTCSGWSAGSGGTSSAVAPYLQTFPLGSTSILIRWPASSGATSYEWGYRTVGGAWSGSTSTTDLDAVQGGLAPGTPYEFRARACRSTVCSPWKTELTYTTASAVPDAPTDVAGVEGNGAVGVTWTPPAGGQVVLGYKVHAYVSGVEIPGSPVNLGLATSYMWTGLSAASTYTFRVEASNNAGLSALSSASAAVTPNSTGNGLAPDAVLASTNLDSPAVGPISDDPDDYALPDTTSIAGTLTTEKSMLHVSFPTPPAAISGAQEFRVYVKKRNTGGFSTNANVVLHLYENGALVSSSSASSVTSNLSSGLISHSWSAAGRTPAEIELVIEQTSGTNVTIDVYAVEWNAAPHAFVVPNAPTSVVGAAGVGQVALTWSAPAAVDAPVTDYRVTAYSAIGGTPVGVIGPRTRQLGSSATSYTFNGLKPGVAYTFKVEAYNGVGWGAVSNASAAVTPTH